MLVSIRAVMLLPDPQLWAVGFGVQAFGCNVGAGFGVHYTINILRNPQNPILILKAPYIRVQAVGFKCYGKSKSHEPLNNGTLRDAGKGGRRQTVQTTVDGTNPALPIIGNIP